MYKHASEVDRSLTALMTLLFELCIELTDVLTLVYPETECSSMEGLTGSRTLSGIKARRLALQSWASKATEIAPSLTPGMKESAEPGICQNWTVIYTCLIWIYYQ